MYLKHEDVSHYDIRSARSPTPSPTFPFPNVPSLVALVTSYNHDPTTGLWTSIHSGVVQCLITISGSHFLSFTPPPCKYFTCTGKVLCTLSRLLSGYCIWCQVGHFHFCVCCTCIQQARCGYLSIGISNLHCIKFVINLNLDSHHQALLEWYSPPVLPQVPCQGYVSFELQIAHC